jgi:hypothetical protein
MLPCKNPIAVLMLQLCLVLPAVLLLQPTSRPDVGRAIDIAAETVHKAGVIFVASAGNAGGHNDMSSCLIIDESERL